MKFEIDPLSPNDINNTNVVVDNFQQESKQPSEVFWREFGQNELDVEAVDGRKKKSFSIQLKKLSELSKASEVRQLLSETDDWLEAAKCPNPNDISDPYVLVIYEQNTVGLQGSIDTTTEPSEKELWINFWFTEGRQTKTGNANGRRGQGKITYFKQSGYKTIFAITKRKSDDKTYLFGMCNLESTFHLNDKRYKERAYYCKKNLDGQYVPTDDRADISEFENIFELEPRTDYGTTWVFPYVSAAELTREEIIKILVNEYYYPILSDELRVDVMGEMLDGDSLPSLINKYDITNPTEEKRKFLATAKTTPECDLLKAPNDDWLGDYKSSSIKDGTFSEDQVEQARTNLDAGKLVGFKLPIAVTAKGKPTQSSFITIYLQKAEHLKRSDTLVIRSSLTISKERPLDGVGGKYFGLLIAEDKPIASFLAESEDAMHVSFNEPRLKGKYEKYQDTLRRVRWALPQLVRSIFWIPGRDSQALASFFSIPGTSGPSTTPSTTKQTTQSSENGEGSESEGLEITSKKTKFLIDQKGGTVSVSGIDDTEIEVGHKFEIRYAYQTGKGVGDAFKNWEYADFDLADDSKISCTDVARIVNRQNLVQIEVTGAKPKVVVKGFSESCNVKVKIEEI